MTRTVHFTRGIALMACLGAFSMHGHAAEPAPDRICKAAIAAIMGRDPTTMKATVDNSGVVSLYYVREDDGKKWSYKCKVNGQRVVWAADPGRWRNSTGDEVITFRQADKSIEIVQEFGDGSSSREKFNSNVLE